MTLMTRFAIFAAMKRASLLLALMIAGAVPLFAQSTEFGVIAGGSRRFVDNGLREGGVEFLDSSFSFSNSAVELYWGSKIDEDTWFQIRAGRIETQVAEAYTLPNVNGTFRRDAEGEVQHVDVTTEYRFTEPFGTTGLFGGVGLYRQSGDGIASSNNFGWSAGVNSNFPITRRYGIVLQAAYHWTRADFRPRYLTAGGGLRISF
jgi:hypothetical protein